jgi:hypothetical protein
MRRAWELGSPSSGRLQKLPTTANSPLSQTCGRLVSCSQNLLRMDAYLIQVRAQTVEGSAVCTSYSTKMICEDG